MSSPRYPIALICALFSLSTPVYAAEPVSITACRQEIVGTSGTLTVDLDCSADPLAVGVSVIDGTLNLNGHSITGAEIAVACANRCVIQGPGTISGNRTGVDQFATSSKGGKVKVIDVTITGNEGLGLGGDRVRVERSTITGNGGVVVAGNEVGGGVIGDRVFVRGSGVNGNFDYGIFARRIALRSATAQANGTAPGCIHEHGSSSGACGDLISSARPSVNATSQCDVSVRPPSGTWGVCSSDTLP